MAKYWMSPGQQTYNREGFDDENQLERMRLKSPQQLTQALVFLGSQLSQQYKLSFLTEGQRRVKYIKDNEYFYPVVNNLHKAAIRVARNQYQAGDQPGRGGLPFVMYLEDRVPITFMLLTCNQKKVYVKGCEPAGNMFKVTVVLNTTNKSEFLPLSEFEVGKKVAMIASFNSLSASRGNESYSEAPYKTKNQMQLIRQTYKWEGDIPRQVVNFNFRKASDNGSVVQKWMDVRKWQLEQEWMQYKEWALWYTEYNKDANGNIALIDPQSGKPVPTGSGVFEQIPNKDSYGILSPKRLTDIMTTLFHGTSDAERKDITLFTGRGGRRVFDASMKQAMGDLRLTPTEDKFVKGSGSDMEFGGYFTSYLTPDGDRVRVAHHPMFDSGPGAQVSDTFEGLPEESYRMIFLDNSTYSGEANIQMIVKEGMEDYEGEVNGVGSNSRGQNTSNPVSDFHGSSIEKMTQRGIQIMRATNCLDLKFKRGWY